jgi:hypothetical protein
MLQTSELLFRALLRGLQTPVGAAVAFCTGMPRGMPAIVFTFEFPTQFVLEILIVFRIMNIVCGFDILRQRCKVVLRVERKIFGWFYFWIERLFLTEEWD